MNERICERRARIRPQPLPIIIIHTLLTSTLLTPAADTWFQALYGCAACREIAASVVTSKLVSGNTRSASVAVLQRLAVAQSGAHKSHFLLAPVPDQTRQVGL